MSGIGRDVFAMPGASVGKYTIVRRLAVGGMAEVYLSKMRSLHGFEKLVVLKRVLPVHAQNPEFVRMFFDEARLAATLDHPNIAQVYDIGEVEGSYFYAMEYVHGLSLLAIMSASSRTERPLELEHALAIVAGICAGIHHAHEKRAPSGAPLNIVHRDVSPPNVMVTYEGGVKLLDFGIAKAATVRSSTDMGTFKGKVPYMSPEQCRAQPVDRRSDLFSIGVLLYELTVGKRLFFAAHEMGVMHLITRGGYPPPTSVRPEYPPELEAIVMRALQLLPDSRYPTARALQTELEDYARRNQLSLSSVTIADLMQGLFGDDARRWPTNPAMATVDPPTGGVGETRAADGSGVGQGGGTDPTQRLHVDDPSAASSMGQLGQAMDRVLAGDLVVEEDTEGLDPSAVGRKKRFDIDLDNLDVEELEPTKYSDD